MRITLTKIDTSLIIVGTNPTWFSSSEKVFCGILCVNVSKCIYICTMQMVRREVQVEKLMSNSIINLREPNNPIRIN